jgi:paraquat-inducible protein B
LSKQANPTIVGGFILGALAIVVAAAVVFGSGRFFRERPVSVAYFESSVSGLNVGAPVVLRGVRVGTVSDVKLEVDVHSLNAIISVYMEFEFDHLHYVGGKSEGTSGVEHGDRAAIKKVIDNGLRARLRLQSFVTGQSFIELDFVPGSPIRLVGLDPSVPEIPTLKSDIEQAEDVLRKLPLDEIANSLLRTSDAAGRVLSSPEIPQLLRSLLSLADGAGSLVEEVRGEVKPALAQVTETGDAATRTLKRAQDTLGEIAQLAKDADHLATSDLRTTLRSADLMAKETTAVLADADSILAPGSAARADFEASLKNLAAATRSLRSVADQLDRKPNALIMGR